jgi:hypothetical protein
VLRVRSDPFCSVSQRILHLGCISSKFQESYTPQPSGLWLTYGIKRHRTMFHGRYAKSFHSFSHTEPTVDTQNNTCAILLLQYDYTLYNRLYLKAMGKHLFLPNFDTIVDVTFHLHTP